ncbi:hypothetical protein HAX54_039245 [Datura stramonium]|uniref:Uncharacterized protein n=1 Tax=Datura stramonium TaxID=4076 RepID=A0ABS8VMA9_DATST|nr:hypothetical protein [Datura stramonium]
MHEKISAINETLREELQRLKIEAGQHPTANGNRGMHPHLPPHPQPFVQCGNHHAQQQQQHIPRSAASRDNYAGGSLILLQNLAPRKTPQNHHLDAIMSEEDQEIAACLLQLANGSKPEDRDRNLDIAASEEPCSSSEE